MLVLSEYNQTALTLKALPLKNEKNARTDHGAILNLFAMICLSSDIPIID